MKTELLNVRISENDKTELKRLADERQMSMSEFLIYLIRREAEKRG